MNVQSAPSNGNGEIHVPGLLERPVLVPIGRMPGIDAHENPALAVRDAAAADQHACIAPTHVMMKGEKIIGYLSLNGMPNVHAWFDTKHPHALDSLKMIEMGELLFRNNGVQMYSLLCAKESPFTAHLERMGFKKLGETVLYVKQL